MQMRTRLALLVVFTFVVLPSCGLRDAMREGARRARENEFRMCALELRTDFQFTPPTTCRDEAGNNLYSWRLRQHLLYGKVACSIFKLPWDDPSHRKLREGPGPKQYCYADANNTCVFAITGPGTAFDETVKREWTMIDGETVIIVEVPDSQTHWMAPGDLDIRSIPSEAQTMKEVGIASEFPGGAHIGFADGQVWFISETVPFADLKKFFTVDGASQNDRKAVLGKYRIRYRRNYGTLK